MFARQPIFRTPLGLVALAFSPDGWPAQTHLYPLMLNYLRAELPVGPSRPISLP